MNKRVLCVALSLALVGGAGVGLLDHGSAGAGASQPATAAGESWISAVGKTEGAREELGLRAEVAGTIRAVHVRANQDVAAGELLVELNNDAQQAQVQRTEALVKGREADLDRARDTQERARRSQHGVSPAEVQQAEAALRRARADCDVVRAEHRLAQAELARTRLRAPWAGRVLRVHVEPGALVGPGSAQPLLLLADVSRRRVRAFIEELDALRVRPGQRAVVTVDGLPERTFSGRIGDEVLLRMDREAPRSDAPGEYQDIYHRPVVIDLDAGLELPLNLRVQVRIASNATP
jgi:membrane fusion protein (multidrug efflux system)